MLCVPAMYAAGLLFVPRLAAALLANPMLGVADMVTVDPGFAHVGYQAWPCLGTVAVNGDGHVLHEARVLSKHERGLGMDALVLVCSRNTNVIIVWAWVL